MHHFIRHIFIATILLILANKVFSQDIVSSDMKNQFLTNSQVNLTPSQIISNFRIADQNWLNQFSGPARFESAYNLNVFDYFKLSETHDSDLKKEVFKKSTDYRILLDSLNKIKFNYLNSVYFQTGFNNVGEETFDMENNNEEQGYQVNYDIRMKGFFIGIGVVLPYQCFTAFCPKVIEDIEFKQLTIAKKYNLKSNSDKSYTQYLFISMDANKALEIENNRNQIEILRIFNITGLYSKTFNDADFIADNHGQTCKVKVVKGGSMRLLIYNKGTDQVYFDKLYPDTLTK